MVVGHGQKLQIPVKSALNYDETIEHKYQRQGLDLLILLFSLVELITVQLYILYSQNNPKHPRDKVVPLDRSFSRNQEAYFRPDSFNPFTYIGGIVCCCLLFLRNF